MNKKSKKTIKLLIALLAVVIIVTGYGVLASSKGLWPFAASGVNNVSSSDTTVEINKLEVKDDVLTVGIKVSEAKDKGHCVLTVTGKKAGLKIDEAETKKKMKQDIPFESCLGWSIGVKDFPAGKYNVEVEFVSSGKSAKASDKVTLK